MFGNPSAGTVEVDVRGDFETFRRDLDREGRNAGSSFGSSFGSGFGSKVTNLVGTYVGAQFARGVIDQASDLQEATNVTGLAFGEARGEVDKLASSAADMFGLTEAQFRQLGAQVGNIFVGAGVAERDAAKLTNNLVSRAADIGSAWNASTDEVVESINAGLIGSFEPLRKYGVIIDVAAVKQQALTMGLVKEGEELDNASEKLAIQALILEQTANVAGDFKNTQDGVANSSKTVAAMWGDMQAQLGAGLLPALSAVLKVLRGLGPDGMRVVVVGGLIAFGFVKLVAGAKALSGAFSVLAANPWVLVAAAIVAAGVLIYRNWDTITEKLRIAWDWVKVAAGEVVEWFTQLGSHITDAFGTVAGFVEQWWPLFLGIMTGGIGLVVGLVVQNWDAIVAKTSEVANAIGSFFANAWAVVEGVIADTGERVVNWIIGIPGRISSAFTTLADTIAAPFRTAFASIKSAWNSTVGGFGFSIPGWVPEVGGNNFRIPSMATGAVVDSPTLAVVGDAGSGNPEIVTPERLMFDTVRAALDGAVAGGGATGDTFTVNGPLMVVDGADLADPAQLERHAIDVVRVAQRELNRARRGRGRARGGLTE